MQRSKKMVISYMDIMKSEEVQQHIHVTWNINILIVTDNNQKWSYSRNSVGKIT
jgi:hypothetical protein